MTYGVNTWLPTIFRTYYKYSVADALRIRRDHQSWPGWPALFCCAMLVDHLGRRPWFILAYTLGAAPLIAIWVARGGQSARSHRYWWRSASCSSPGIRCWSTCTRRKFIPRDCEVLEQARRARGCALLRRPGPAIVGFALTGYGVSGVFLLFGMISLAGAAISLGTVETRERALEEISP